MHNVADLTERGWCLSV